MLSTVLFALSLQAVAQPAPAPSALLPPPMPELVVGATYDPSVPTLRDVVGHDLGEALTSPEEIVGYLRALQRAAPDRTRLVEYGRSWQGRPLVALLVASPQRIAALDSVRRDLQRLADPRQLDPAEQQRLVGELPVVVALLHSVHGGEVSPAGAALAMAYHLLAATNDPAADTIRRETIVIIDPLQNPDGRARFLASNALGRAARPDSDPLAAERDEPWPGARSNHYLFDLNRDWFAQTQPESAARVRLLLDWMPQVVVDLHEMGGESTYFFPPPAVPTNPHVTPAQQAMLDTIGRAIAAHFDDRGFPYFTREVFDAFYPGYGASWPATHGAIGMTFEKASARGLVYRRRDGTLLTYGDGIVEHFTAALATAETAARNRRRLLQEFVEFRRDAVRAGQTGTREYVLTGPDAGQVERLARLLTGNGIEVRRSLEPLAIGSRTIPAGAFIVPLAQPAGRLARNLLDAEVPMDPAFVERQDARRRQRLPDEIYDVSAWSLPLLWDVEAIAVTTPTTVRSEAYPGPASVAPPELPAAAVGYLLPWNASTAGAVIEAQQAGLVVSFSPGPFTLAGRRYTGGTAILRAAGNPDDLRARLADITRRHGAEVVPFDSAFVEAGRSLGSDEVTVLKRPRVLLVWDAPASSLSAGWARYVLERRYGQPVSAIRATALGRVRLHEFDVIVLPSGNYAGAIGEERLRQLKDWMRQGGTLITLAEASRWAARGDVGLLETHTELRGGAREGDSPPKPSAEPSKIPLDLEAAIRPLAEPPEEVPGAILRVDLDTEHWLAAGADASINAWVNGQRVFSPLRLDKGRNVGVYATADRVRASGILWPEARDQIAQKAFLMYQPVGQGHLVAFAEDPNTRAFAEATMQLFINAVILGPSR